MSLYLSIWSCRTTPADIHVVVVLNKVRCICTHAPALKRLRQYDTYINIYMPACTPVYLIFVDAQIEICQKRKIMMLFLFSFLLLMMLMTSDVGMVGEKKKVIMMKMMMMMMMVVVVVMVMVL